MSNTPHTNLVYTQKDLCKVCYTCVRECPVKAIRIMNGQAEVMIERCIGCGNCVKVCSQGAKVYYNSNPEVKALVASEHKVAALLAPSFAAEFSDIKNFKKLVGMIRSLGFDLVNEVAFGADMVAREYEKLMDLNGEKPHISSDCPAIVYYIRQYHPGLVPYLAPVASPMVAITRILRKKHGENLKVVFIGPCIAKKAESDEVDAAITFTELRYLLASEGIVAEEAEESEFDPPFAGKGAIFPVCRGMLQTVNRSDDIAEGNIVVAEGRVNFRDAVKEFESGLLQSHHLELLCCEGCIMGPGMSKGGKRYTRRTQISNYVREKLNRLDNEQWQQQVETFGDVDLSQHFKPADRRIPLPDEKKIEEALLKMGKYTLKDHLNCGACGYETCVDHAIAIVEGLAETEMCLPFTIEKLHKSIEELNESNDKLATTQLALKQSEKLASMGQLSAGIAHELNNPLGVITMYSNILKDEAPEDSPIRKDLQLIVEQADRCKGIVGGLLNFARKNQVRLQETNIESFVKHSLETVIKSESVKIEFISELSNPLLELDQDQMMQVLTNLEKNAVEAMPAGGVLTVALSGNGSTVEIDVSDTGIGIPEENMDKLFTPFFTTKEMGKGTGLGLPLIYGIVKMHKGQVTVQSNADPEKGATGTTFKITIPRKREL
ncbi:MAG: 4Fe-4S binding protein [Bacteroidales bacterium]|nr:4Fe-4S binding protein [Bacteroidales bacterium]